MRSTGICRSLYRYFLNNLSTANVPAFFGFFTAAAATALQIRLHARGLVRLSICRKRHRRRRPA